MIHTIHKLFRGAWLPVKQMLRPGAISRSLALGVALASGFAAHASAQSAPGGIANGLRTWLDASDVDGDGNPANNPASGVSVATWADKSGQNNPGVTLPGKK